MKNSTSVVLIALLLFACSGKEEPINHHIIVAGIISNIESGPIKVYSNEEIASDSIADDGSFNIKFESSQSDYFTFRTKNTSFNLFMSPGDSIYIEADAENFGDSFRAEADKIIENTYLRKKAKVINTHQMNDFMKLMKKNKDDYFAKTDSIKSDLKNLLTELKSNKEISKEFLKLEEAYLKYQFILMDNIFPNYHRFSNNLSQSDSIDFPIKETEEKIASIELNDADLLTLPAFRNLLDIKVQKIILMKFKQDSTLRQKENIYLTLSYEVADSIFQHHDIKEYYRFKLIKEQLDFMGPTGAVALYEDFIATSKNQNYLSKLKESMSKWEPILAGKESPDFKFVTLKDEEVKLSDLRGKLVYIDVWATWCGPCIAEHPNWNKMMDEYKDKDIAFVSISIDDSKEPWLKMVTQKNMGGHQWFTENAWQSELAQHYNIRGIPRFILLDKEGKIIDPSAPRPSGSIRTVVDKYL
ncbi:MAG TPA: TlpA disulfide reductase family protein [Cyclobacteriaceae bacterium]|nr:TlpA disulfide reductase family protein [Cyclobacteriaceae bacterium]